MVCVVITESHFAFTVVFLGAFVEVATSKILIVRNRTAFFLWLRTILVPWPYLASVYDASVLCANHWLGIFREEGLKWIALRKSLAHLSFSRRWGTFSFQHGLIRTPWWDRFGPSIPLFTLWRFLQIVPCFFGLVIFFVLVLVLWSVDISYVRTLIHFWSLFWKVFGREFKMITRLWHGWLCFTFTNFWSFSDVYFSAIWCTAYFQSMRSILALKTSLWTVLRPKGSMLWSSGLCSLSFLIWLKVFVYRRRATSRMKNDLKRSRYFIDIFLTD